MVCHLCNAANAKKFGKTSQGRERYRCRTCRKTFSERPERPLGDMRVPVDKALLILNLLCEGSGIRAVSRVTGCHQGTILKLLVQVGEGCGRLLAEQVRDVPVKDVQADEVWTFVHAKEGTKKRRTVKSLEAGDADCFIGMERHSKLVLAWHIGRRDFWGTHDFMGKLKLAAGGEFQLTTDGFNAYPEAVEFHLGARASYAMLVKGARQRDGGRGAAVRSAAPHRQREDQRLRRAGGAPYLHVARRARQLDAARPPAPLHAPVQRLQPEAGQPAGVLALFFAYYNFCRMHRSIGMTPAMAAGIARKPWSVAELATAAMAA